MGHGAKRLNRERGDKDKEIGGGDKNKERGGVGKYERKVGREAGDKDIGREGIQQGDACGNRWRLHRMKGHDAARTGVH